MLLPHESAATFHRTALLLGLTTGDAVVAWADAALACDPSPPDALICVALVAPTDLSALRSALQPLAADPEPPEIVMAMISLLARDLASGRRSCADSCEVLRQLLRFLVLPAALHDEIESITTAHYLASHAVEGRLAAAERAVLDWLAPYALPDASSSSATAP